MFFKQSKNLFFILFSFIPMSLVYPSFSYFDLELTESDKQILQNLNIMHEGAYNNFGHLEHLKQEIAEFVQLIGNDQKQAEKASIIIENLVINAVRKLKIQLDMHYETAWVTLRASQANDAFDIPRWHTDGYYYQPMMGKQYKMVCCFKGAGTLFCKVSNDVREAFTELSLNAYAAMKKVSISEQYNVEQNRRIQAEALLANSQIIQAGTAQGMLFVVGDDVLAAIHSEPPIHHDRLFISILPGSCEQIKELDHYWNKESKAYNIQT